MIKYDNLLQELPNLQTVLADAIQGDVLEIKKIDTECARFIAACDQIPNLKRAVYVIFSKYIKKSEHRHETFAFVDETGEVVCHVSGQEMALYGLLSPCTNLTINDEYAATDL